MSGKAKKNPKGRRESGREEKKLLELLSNLSDHEIRRVAACAILILDRSELERLHGRLGEETGSALRRILSARSAGPKSGRVTASKAKVLAEWENAWSDWSSRVFESGEEDGNYIYQEHHWEPPCLDTSALADDLEPIAARMKKLLKRVLDDDIDPDFSFAEAIEDAVENVGSGLPEWMEDIEGLYFGPQVTGCLLEWEWMVARQNDASAFEFLDRICKLEATVGEMSLDTETLTSFILGLDEADQMDILQGLTEHRQSPHWADALRSIHSAWFVIYQELTRKWDRSRYIESCRTNISRNWEFALPILKDLRGQKAFDEAIPVIETAVRALLHLRDSEMWDPREELLIAHPAMMHRTEVAPSPVPLLEGWRKVAEALGQDEMATALKLQVITYRRWADWDVVLSAFRQVASPRLASLADRLFASWKSLIVDRTLGGRYVEHELSEMSWVHSLVDAARAGTGGKTMFRLAVRHWLEDVEAKPDALEPSREALAVLTLDLDEKSELRRLSPTLKRLISSPDWSARSTLRTSRRRRLHMLKPTSLFTDIIGLWRRNVHRLVPDPAQEVNSNYERSADWLAAVLELNTRSYKKIVSEWAVTHRRRRNLWKALAKKNLPLSEKP